VPPPPLPLLLSYAPALHSPHCHTPHPTPLPHYTRLANTAAGHLLCHFLPIQSHSAYVYHTILTPPLLMVLLPSPTSMRHFPHHTHPMPFTTPLTPMAHTLLTTSCLYYLPLLAEGFFFFFLVFYYLFFFFFLHTLAVPGCLPLLVYTTTFRLHLSPRVHAHRCHLSPSAAAPGYHHLPFTPAATHSRLRCTTPTSLPSHTA